MKDARQLAVKALVKVNSEGGYSNLVMDALLDAEGMERRDNAFATALFYGVLERQITLDYCIARYSKTTLGKMDKQVREILRISFYQLLYMESVPESACVNEGVALARKMGKTSAGSFINGVLRAFIRDGKALFAAGEEEKLGQKQQVCIKYSAPEWLFDLFAKQYGAQSAEEILQASVGRPPTFIKINNLRTTAEKLTAELKKHDVEVIKVIDTPKNCMEIGVSGDIARLPSFKLGHFHVQDMASQICCAALMTEEGHSVLDVCAAPGGKSFTITQNIGDKGKILACDLYAQRVNLIASGAKRLGLKSIHTAINNAEVFEQSLGEFDRVLCDVPCSGLGIIRRKPEIKYKNPQDFTELPAIQYSILKTSSKYLRQGGLLLYSTCTLNRAENEEVVAKFLTENPSFEMAEEATTLLPGSYGGDGFFFAPIRRC